MPTMHDLVPAQYDYSLAEAASRGDLLGMRRAIDCGASLGARDSRGRRILRIAIESKRHDAVDLLLGAGADPHGDSSFSPMLCAASLDDERSILALAQAGAKPRHRHAELRDPLHLACELGYAKAARALLSIGADPAVRERGSSALMAACHKGRSGAAEALLAFEPPLEEKDDHGLTALVIAIQAGSLSCAQLLLEAGADPFHQVVQRELGPIGAAEWARSCADRQKAHFRDSSNAEAIYVLIAAWITRLERDELFEACAAPSPRAKEPARL